MLKTIPKQDTPPVCESLVQGIRMLVSNKQSETLHVVSGLTSSSESKTVR